ncbi:hypothetical protein DTO212C5_6042 [Paecilomyces variotii]|nr:hypothetical protein DTO212C5_6042 [Paecilomyces variotii]
MWMNMGYWKHTQSFPEACTALLEKVLRTAGLLDSNGRPLSVRDSSALRIIDVGCGCGDQTIYLMKWLARIDDHAPGSERRPLFDAYVGINVNQHQAEFARQRIKDTGRSDSIHIFCADAADPTSWSRELKDAVTATSQQGFGDKQSQTAHTWLLALDTLYHFKPSRDPLLSYAARELRASFMAFDLILADSVHPVDNILLRAVCFMSSIPFSNFKTLSDYRDMLVRAGYASDNIEIHDISEYVFSGIGGYMERREAELRQFKLSLGKLQVAGKLFSWWGRSNISSNAQISTALPAGLVAVFVGGTDGIGAATAKQFARHVREPRIYIIGRSQKSGNRVVEECKKLNHRGQYTLLLADVSLLSAVDDICRKIEEKETVVNLLFLSAGNLGAAHETSEGLPMTMALVHYSRVRFILNFLPLIRHAPGLRRVVSVFSAHKEGHFHADDIQARHLSVLSKRAHIATMVTLSLEALARKAPEVSFIHANPGTVKTKMRDMPLVMRAASSLIGSFSSIPLEESGERHLFLATSAMYRPSIQNHEKGGINDAACGVPLAIGLTPAIGSNGQTSSGVYSVDWDGETYELHLETYLHKLRESGDLEEINKHTENEFKRITGSVASV